MMTNAREANIVFINKWENAGIRPVELFFHIRDELDLRNSSFEDVLQALEKKANEISMKFLGKTPSTNSFNRSRGDWFELCVLASMWEYNEEYGGDYYFFKMPDSRNEASSYLGLFKKDVRDKFRKYNLHCSNPDFVCIKPKKSIKQQISIRTAWEDGSKHVQGRLDLDEILFALSAKTNPRPDRRYQNIHEATTLKTIHLIENKPEKGIAYYVVMLSMSDEDKRIYKYPITYLLNEGRIEKAINKSIIIDNFNDLWNLYDEIMEEITDKNE